MNRYKLYAQIGQEPEVLRIEEQDGEVGAMNAAYNFGMALYDQQARDGEIPDVDDIRALYGCRQDHALALYRAQRAVSVKTRYVLVPSLAELANV